MYLKLKKNPNNMNIISVKHLYCYRQANMANRNSTRVIFIAKVIHYFQDNLRGKKILTKTFYICFQVKGL